MDLGMCFSCESGKQSKRNPCQAFPNLVLINTEYLNHLGVSVDSVLCASVGRVYTRAGSRLRVSLVGSTAGGGSIGDANREVPVNETFHEQTDDELTEKELKQVEAGDQAIQTILLGLPEDIYAAVDSCETAQEIWLRVQQMMKGSDIGIQEKKAKLFNEWERFTSTDGESIESYYHRFSKLMNDFKRNKHFPEKIASNLKFLNNLTLMKIFLLVL
ncbi:hypothetical protein Tco_0578087 [Tanacetum coccineum]